MRHTATRRRHRGSYGPACKWRSASLDGSLGGRNCSSCRSPPRVRILGAGRPRGWAEAACVERTVRSVDGCDLRRRRATLIVDPGCRPAQAHASRLTHEHAILGCRHGERSRLHCRPPRSRTLTQACGPRPHGSPAERVNRDQRRRVTSQLRLSVESRGRMCRPIGDRARARAAAPAQSPAQFRGG